MGLADSLVIHSLPIVNYLGTVKLWWRVISNNV